MGTDLYVHEKRPMFEYQETFAKETCVYMKRDLCVYAKNNSEISGSKKRLTFK